MDLHELMENHHYQQRNPLGVLSINRKASFATAGLQPVSRVSCLFSPPPLVAGIAPTPPGKENMLETAAIPPSAASPQWEEGRKGCQQCNGLAETSYFYTTVQPCSPVWQAATACTYANLDER